MLKPEEEEQLVICPWCYVTIRVETEEEEPFTCSTCRRKVYQEDLEDEEDMDKWKLCAPGFLFNYYN